MSAEIVARRDPAPAAHLARILAWLLPATEGKYGRGQARHGGHLAAKNGVLRMAEEEALDLPTYLHTLREQLEDALHYLNAGIERDEIESLLTARDQLRAVLAEPGE